MSKYDQHPRWKKPSRRRGRFEKFIGRNWEKSWWLFLILASFLIYGIAFAITLVLK